MESKLPYYSQATGKYHNLILATIFSYGKITHREFTILELG